MQHSRSIRAAGAALFLALLIPLTASAIPPRLLPVQTQERCFRETGQCISGEFRAFWERNGGLPVFGLPISTAGPEQNRDTGQTYLTQWFERNRFELHKNGTSNVVQLGRLGDDRLLQIGRQWQAEPRATETLKDCLFFAETERYICDMTTGVGFKTYFLNHGLSNPNADALTRSIGLFGLPLTEARVETNSSGDTVLTQWFERARFELHLRQGPSDKPQGQVLLGLLGNEVRRPPTTAPTPRPDVQLSLEEVGRGLAQPLFLTHANDGSNRRFVVEKGGTIRTIPDNRLFLDITGRVRASGSEQGLLGLAFHPRFRDNGYFYVNYTDRNGDTVIARFGSNIGRSAGNPDGEAIILRQDQPAANHNGGMLAFGPDGYLYIGLGDGGGANDTYRNAQNKRSLLGKLLRIDIDRSTPYTIPSNNPFATDSTARPEVWAYGLRNPWRFSFDRATGDLFIADVGQGRSEWIHWAAKGSAGGANYGWPIVEGTRCLQGSNCDRSGLTPPIAEYGHTDGCAVTGGYVYRGSRYPALKGLYVFGDFCSGRIWTIASSQDGVWTMDEQLKASLQISSFGEDEDGELYITDFGSGRVFRIVEAD
jgi:glucose/arabinose dehydrogenase